MKPLQVPVSRPLLEGFPKPTVGDAATLTAIASGTSLRIEANTGEQTLPPDHMALTSDDRALLRRDAAAAWASVQECPLMLPRWCVPASLGREWHAQIRASAKTLSSRAVL
jgi:hypothetical protein